ncbi:MAG: hypothetical protein DRQ49_19270, partial [Gammaproteobacteria bacterium]
MKNNQDLFDEAFSELLVLSRDPVISRVINMAQMAFDVEMLEAQAKMVLIHHFNNNLTLLEMRGPVGDMDNDEVAEM